MDNRLETLYRMQPLSAAETDALFTEVFAGRMTETCLASLLTALKMKGETPDEIRGAAAAMLRTARPFPKVNCEVGEIVGTGGDGAGTPEESAKRLERTGFAFCFAQSYHPAMRFAAPVRKALGTRTIFNILGPLTNPAHRS